jgi:hypothetical protein
MSGMFIMPLLLVIPRSFESDHLPRNLKPKNREMSRPFAAVASTVTLLAIIGSDTEVVLAVLSAVFVVFAFAIMPSLFASRK